jgi:hypothetical protein
MTGALDLPYRALYALIYGQKSEARRLLQDVVLDDPKNILAWLCLALASPRDGAEVALRKVLALDPTNPVALRNLRHLKASPDPRFEFDVNDFWKTADDTPDPQAENLFTSKLSSIGRRFTTKKLTDEDEPIELRQAQEREQMQSLLKTKEVEAKEPEAELAVFGQNEPTMHLGDLAKFGEETQTMPAAFLALFEMTRAVPPPPETAAPTPFSRFTTHEEATLTQHFGLRPAPDAPVGKAVRMSDLAAMAGVPDPEPEPEVEGWGANLPPLLRPAKPFRKLPTRPTPPQLEATAPVLPPPPASSTAPFVLPPREAEPVSVGTPHFPLIIAGSLFGLLLLTLVLLMFIARLG